MKKPFDQGRACHLQKRHVAAAASLVMVAAALPSTSIAQTAAPEPTGATAESPSQGVVLQRIVVTATKRPTLLQETPDAVSVLTGSDMQLKGQSGLDDLKISVPTINFSSTSNTSQLSVRGVGNTFISAGGDPAVALYQDGAYVSDQTTTNADFFDVRRIEVLRGPQGGLYGRNAIGGAINIISEAPSPTFGARVGLTLGDYGRRDVDGYVTGPSGVADTSLRASFQVKKHDGYLKNRLEGQPGAPSTLDDENSQALRLQSLTSLPGDGSLRLMVSRYHESSNGPALSVEAREGIVYPVEQLYGAVPSTDPRRVYANVGGKRTDLTNFNAAFDSEIAGNALGAVLNYRDSDQKFSNDCDGTAIDNCRYLRTTTSKEWFFDAHLASPDSADFRWLVGATHLDFKINQRNDVTFPFPLSYLDPTAPSNVPFGFHVASGGLLNVTSSAAYIDLQQQLSSQWKVTGQLRYSETRKEAKELLLIPDFEVNAVDVPKSLSEKSWPFKVGVEWHPVKETLLYGHFATAVKDGAINLGALQADPVRPEKVKSVELGLKTSLLANRVQLNMSVFSSAYRDRQISQLVGTVIALVNVPKAQVNGMEVELSAIPVRDMRVNVGLGYLDATLKEFSNGRTIPGLAGGPLINLSGNTLPYVPRMSVNAGVDWDLRAFDSKVTLGANYVYRSRIYFDEFNDRDNSQAPVGTLNLSARLKPDDGAWTIFANLNNATNQSIRTGTTIYSGLIGAPRAVSYAPPRTISLGASWSFY